MKTKSFILLVIGIVLIGAAISGAFIGGEAVGKSNARATANQTLQSRLNQLGQNGTGAGRQAFQQRAGQADILLPGAGGGGFGGGGTIGTVEKIENNILTLSTQNGTKISVIISNNTTIEKMATVTIADIPAGSAVTVGGQRNADGSVQARNILITPATGAQ